MARFWLMAQGDEERVCRREDIDLTRAAHLENEEGMLAARLDVPMTVPQIAVMMSWATQKTRAVVDRLLDKGILIRESERHKDPYAGRSFPTPLMNAACELSQEERKRVIWFYDKLDEWTHYDILHAHPRDDHDTIGRKYREQSAQWHPDRWRRELGPFKRMIDAIFQRLLLARKVLSDPEQRKAYDREVAHLYTVDEDARIQDLDPETEQWRAEREAKRRDEAVERRKRRNPVIKNLAMAKAEAAKAAALEVEGEMVAALRAAQTALTYDGRSDEYRQLVERLTEKAANFRVAPYLKRGRAAEGLARWSEAVTYYEEAVRIGPEMPEPKKRLAYCLIMGGYTPQEALSSARRALEGLPDDAEAHFVLGLCLDKTGQRKAAIRAFRRAVELKPNYREANKKLWNVRLGLGGFSLR